MASSWRRISRHSFSSHWEVEVTGFEVGSKLPLLRRSLDLPRLISYAAATWDWYPIHYDPAAVAAAKLRSPIVDGQMLGALLAEQAIDWAGEGAFVRRMAFRFKSMVFAGDTVQCEGEVESSIVGSSLVGECGFANRCSWRIGLRLMAQPSIWKSPSEQRCRLSAKLWAPRRGALLTNWQPPSRPPQS